MGNLLRNIRFGIRSLRRNPGMTLTVLLTLALGIGANTAIFTVDYATLLAPLPYPHPKQLVMVWSKIQGHRNGVSAGDFLDWKRQNTSFQDLNAWTGTTFNLATKNRPEFIDATSATVGYLRMLGAPLLMGRYFTADEGQPGQDHVAILTHKLWIKLGANPKIIGTNIRLNNQPYTVVGVERASIFDREPSELVVPLVFKPNQINHSFHWLLVMGRLKPGVTLSQARQNMNAVAAHVAQVHPKSDEGWGARVDPLKNDFLPPQRIQMLWLLLGAVGFLLLIACVNVANLLLARGITRQKELAVRSAVGASRAAIFGQLLTESIVLALSGGVLGVAAGYAMLQGIVAVMPPGTLPAEANLHLNIPILLFTLGATMMAGILTGSAPAWFASRVHPGETLKDSGRTGTSAGKHFLRRILVIGEFGLALTLLAGAGLAIHSFWKLTQVQLGLQTNHVLTFLLSAPSQKSISATQITTNYRDILAHIDAVPGVKAVTATTGNPLYGGDFGMPFTFTGGPPLSDPSKLPETGFGMATPGFFKTFGIRVERGRTFNSDDTASSPRVAMVNHAFVKDYLKAKNPLKQQIIMRQIIPGATKLGPPVTWQIVGVFHDVHTPSQTQLRPLMYVPLWQSPWPQATIAVRTAEPPLAMLHSIAAAVHQVEPEAALAHPQTMNQVRDNTMQGPRFTLILFTFFAVVALLLAAVGIYGVMAFSVAQRSREIALRMALGASRNQVVTLVVREGILMAGIGLGLGLIGAYFVGRLMLGFLFGVSASDPTALGSVAIILMTAALLACWLPAHRAATGANLMEVLRSE